MPDWSKIGSLMDFSAVYYTTQLVRCAFFSFILTGVVMLLRKVFFSGQTFFRGLLWSSFLLLPFLGRLKIFYENEVVLQISWRLTAATMSWIWADRIYMAGIFVTAVCIFGKRLRLWRLVSGMEKAVLGDGLVCVTDMNVTPFTLGLLKPKIVIPKVILENYGRDELRVVVQHEQTHIRLGHLWFGLAWDILRCLFWINPFLTIFQKYFHGDMEDICDRVSIQKSGRTAQEYGLVLLKTLKLLCSESGSTPPALTYAGEREFADMKRRIGEIAGFCPYKRKMCVGMAAAGFLVIAAMLFAIHTNSYARCNESRDIMVGNYNGKPEIVSHDTGELGRMISYDDKYVYVRREAFEDFLRENNAEGEIWIIFGGFYKLPGLAGAAESCIYEKGSRDSTVQIPYESMMDSWYLKLLKLL
ncbi:MAG: M56 family metallopeptidase [Lachnospiraceae bacterium]|nr:M56 family metallopeptidase [Lachnospiraceae bacterium]